MERLDFRLFSNLIASMLIGITGFGLRKFPEFKRDFERLAHEDPDSAAALTVSLEAFLIDRESVGEFIRGEGMRSVYVVHRAPLRSNRAALVIFVDGGSVANIRLERSWSDDEGAHAHLIDVAEAWILDRRRMS